jgi:hypothetical protein
MNREGFDPGETMTGGLSRLTIFPSFRFRVSGCRCGLTSFINCSKIICEKVEKKKARRWLLGHLRASYGSIRRWGCESQESQKEKTYKDNRLIPIKKTRQVAPASH